MNKRLQVLIGSTALLTLPWIASLSLPEHKNATASSSTFTIAESRVGNGYKRRRAQFDEIISQLELSDRHSKVT